MEKISNLLLPIAGSLSKNRYLAAIRDGFIAIMPLVITASIFTLINCVFVGEGNYFDQWFNQPCTGFAQVGNVIGSASMSIMSILLTFTTAKALAKHYDIDTSIAGSTALVSFLCLTPFVSDAQIGEYVTTYYLGAAGMFTAFITAILSIEVLRFLMGFKALIIKMPDSVPSGIARSFNSIIPVALTVIIFALVRILKNF